MQTLFYLEALRTPRPQKRYIEGHPPPPRHPPPRIPRIRRVRPER